jgi:hypothetical protein
MHKSRVVLGCIALILALALLIPLVGCKSSGTTGTSTPTATTTGAVTTATPTSVPTSTPRAKTLQGTLTGTYSGQGPKGPLSGTFSLTILGNGTIQGSTDAGIITGQVDTSGNLNASGTVGTGANANQVTWAGKVTQSGNSLNIKGTWSTINGKRSGTFSGTGVASQ